MSNGRILSIFLLLATSSGAWADTIHFKNGTFITADKVVQNGANVDYFMGATKYSVPQSSVERIDRDQGLGISIGSTSQTNLVTVGPGPAEAPTASVPAAAKPPTARTRLPLVRPLIAPEEAKQRAALLDRILANGQVYDGALWKVEEEGKPQITKLAYMEAGRFELDHGHPVEAVQYFEHALTFAPDDPIALEWYMVGLAEINKNVEAAAVAEKLTRVLPDAGTFAILGLAYYNTDRLADAVAAFKQSVALRPIDWVQKVLARTQHELEVQGNFNQRDSWHFTLRYQGSETSLTLQRDLLDALEDQYRDLRSQLNYTPSENISVILYTNTQFFDVTQAPAWAGGVNDGKLRIPISGVNSVTPELQHVLKHELTHSFVHLITRGNCPNWLNEGLAQLMESRSTDYYGPQLARMFETKKEIPFRYLDGPFARFNARQAVVAYTEALLALEYLRQSWGMDGVQRILQRLRDGDSPDDALYSVTQMHYADLEENLTSYLQKKYAPSTAATE
ncbi:MAG TPA: peptidase MA family metallohydrolase [Terriglobales bacterium]|nr:peptidase MA family metallohydrolase [Terriglobales bacterium]